jgi:hypothetical protein
VEGVEEEAAAGVWLQAALQEGSTRAEEALARDESMRAESTPA